MQPSARSIAAFRRADGDQWYLLDRGQFPLDGRLERADWVRRIDELLPSDVRDRAAIDSATEAIISGVATRHLSHTVDPRLLDPAPADAALDDGVSSEAVPPTPELASDPPADSALEPWSVPAAATIALDVWIDGDGLVRQVTGAPQLGADTITVVRTSADAWIPEYPSPGDNASLTASALIDLGL